MCVCAVRGEPPERARADSIYVYKAGYIGAAHRGGHLAGRERERERVGGDREGGSAVMMVIRPGQSEINASLLGWLWADRERGATHTSGPVKLGWGGGWLRVGKTPYLYTYSPAIIAISAFC